MTENATVNAPMRLKLVDHESKPRTTSLHESTPENELIRLLVERIGKHRYDMWFGCSSIVRKGKTVHIAAESAFVAKWIRAHFVNDLHAAAHHAFGHEVSLDVRTAAHSGTPQKASGTVAERQTAKQTNRRSEQIVEHRNGEHSGSKAHGTSQSQHRGDRTRTQRLTDAQSRHMRSLDDFVVGPSNELAYAAACQVSDRHDALGCSPLLVHGPCGVGKTHLLQGVCRRLLAWAPRGTRIRYVTAEQFTNEYIAAVQKNRLDAFRRAVRNLHMLAIDDVHFLSNKSRTQTEFLYTLDAIDMNGSRVVIASDNHPRRMHQLNQALVSRLLSGMVVEIGLPDERMRIQLIQSLAQQRGMNMTESAISELAQRCTGSVRELEGALTKIRALWTIQRSAAVNGSKNGTPHAPASHRNMPQAPQIGHVVIEQLFADPAMMTRPIHIDRIIEVVCRGLSITLGDLTGNGRHKRIVLARGLIAYLGREMTTMSFPEIARAMGRRNHSTVHTAVIRIRKQIESGDVIQAGHSSQPVTINELLDQLRVAIRQRQDH